MRALLAQIRKLNAVLKKSATNNIEFDELNKELSEILSSNIYVSDIDGKILSYITSDKFPCVINDTTLESRYFPKDFNEDLLKHDQTRTNLFTSDPMCAFGGDVCIYKNQYLMVIPIIVNNKRLGHFILSKYDENYNEDELIVCEYASAIVLMELMRIEEQKFREKVKFQADVKMAYASLSYSEQEAMEFVLDELGSTEGLIIASTLADKAKITKSVISNSLRKFESAGVIRTRSLGMKGTYIKIINPYLMSERKNINI